MNLIKSLFGSKALNNTSGNNSVSIISLDQLKLRTSTDISVQRLSEGYKKWVYKCVSINSSSIAQTEWKLLSFAKYNNLSKRVNYKSFRHDKSLNQSIQYKLLNDKMEEVYNHPVLTLLQHPNPNDTIYDFFYKIVTNMELFGSAYIKVIRNKNGNIQQCDVLHSQYITADIDLVNNTSRGWWYNFGGSTQYFTLDDLIQVSYYNPKDDIYGFAPLQSIFTQYELDNAFDEYQLALMNNGGMPSSVIKYTGKSLKESERDIIESNWNKTLKGVQNNGKIKVIGNDYDVIKLGIDPVDMDFINGRKVTKESILNAFGVPLPFIDPKDTNRSSLDSAIYIYQKYTLMPKIKNICDTINKKIIEQYGDPNLWLSYENPISQDKIDEETERANKTKELVELVKAGIYTAEEAKNKLMEIELEKVE